MTTNAAKVALLKKMLKGLTPKKNFNSSSTNWAYPHCVIGEYKKHLRIDYLTQDNDNPFVRLFGKKDSEGCWASQTLTHFVALSIIRRAIKRWSRKSK